MSRYDNRGTRYFGNDVPRYYDKIQEFVSNINRKSQNHRFSDAVSRYDNRGTRYFGNDVPRYDKIQEFISKTENHEITVFRNLCRDNIIEESKPEATTSPFFGNDLSLYRTKSRKREITKITYFSFMMRSRAMQIQESKIENRKSQNHVFSGALFPDNTTEETKSGNHKITIFGIEVAV